MLAALSAQSGCSSSSDPAGTGGTGGTMAGAGGTMGGSGGSGATQPSLIGYWELVSTYKVATATKATATSGAFVVHFDGSAAALYINNGTSKTCSGASYTLQGDTITYASGASSTLVVTATTLRQTTVKPDPIFKDDPGDYSDFVRVSTFAADGYSGCK